MSGTSEAHDQRMRPGLLITAQQTSSIENLDQLDFGAVVDEMFRQLSEGGGVLDAVTGECYQPADRYSRSPPGERRA